MQKERINQNYVYIRNQKGELQENILTLSEDRKRLTIDTSDVGYAKDSYYILKHDKVMTDGGNLLTNGSEFCFYVP